MGEGLCETVAEEQTKKSRHRKKHLYNAILQQMEFYFSESNLSKDRFLSQLMSQDPYVDLEVFLKFNKIRRLNCSLDDIRKAVSKSDIIELSDDKLKVRRGKPIKIKENVDECTIYVENIKPDASHEWLIQVFTEFGHVVYVSIPKYKHNKLSKGFAFVEFETEKQAQEALEFFHSIGCKMPSDKSPEELQSIATFEGEDGKEENRDGEQQQSEENCDKIKVSDENEEEKLKVEMSDETLSDSSTRKRKISVDEEEKSEKKLKTEGKYEDIQDNQVSEELENKKKKKSKKEKRKNHIKELGLQVLSKKEWKKLRNKYLDLQKKKMKEFKQYLRKQQYNNRNYERNTKRYEENQRQEPHEENNTENNQNKLEFNPGLIVKIKLPEPCNDTKKLKNELKSLSSELKYVDIPLPAGSEEIYLRFGTVDSAKEFCSQECPGEKKVLTGDEEKAYWDKLENDRNIKFAKCAKKQRGRDKLLRKAEKERAKHIRFDDGDK